MSPGGVDDLRKFCGTQRKGDNGRSAPSKSKLEASLMCSIVIMMMVIKIVIQSCNQCPLKLNMLGSSGGERGAEKKKDTQRKREG